MKSFIGATCEEMLEQLRLLGRRGVIFGVEKEQFTRWLNATIPMDMDVRVSTDSQSSMTSVARDFSAAMVPVLFRIGDSQWDLSFIEQEYSPDPVARQILAELIRQGVVAVLLELEPDRGTTPKLSCIAYGLKIPPGRQVVLLQCVCEVLSPFISQTEEFGEYIYVLINPSMPGLCKIGKTTRNPQQRAKELSGTGIATPFLVAYYERVADCSATERLIHEQLSYARVSKDREFFQVDTKVAIDVVAKICGDSQRAR